MNAGVYEIKNLTNGKRYIGSSVNMKRRFLVHRNRLRRQIHCCYHLQNAWKNYGEDSFEFRMLLVCSKDDLLFYEQRAIDILKPHDPRYGYNYRILAKSNSGLSRPHKEETKRKISDTKRGNVINSEETRKKMSLAKIGKPSLRLGTKFTEEQKKRLSMAHKGQKGVWLGKSLPQSMKEKIGETLRGKFVGENNPMYGIRLCGKMNSFYGRKHSDEAKRKMSIAAKNRPSNRKGCKVSDEAKLRMSEIQKVRWEKIHASVF